MALIKTKSFVYKLCRISRAQPDTYRRSRYMAAMWQQCAAPPRLNSGSCDVNSTKSQMTKCEWQNKTARSDQRQWIRTSTRCFADKWKSVALRLYQLRLSMCVLCVSLHKIHICIFILFFRSLCFRGIHFFSHSVFRTRHDRFQYFDKSFCPFHSRPFNHR